MESAMATLLVPGFMTDAALWDDLAPRLQSIGPLTFVDLAQDDSIESMAQRALADAPEAFILLGFSMGGYVAREIVRLAPQRVQALILVATSARGDSQIQARRKAAAVARAGASRFHGLSRAAIATSLHPDRADDAALIEHIHAMGERLGGEVFARQSALRRDGDVDTLARIDCPTLVIAADADRLRSLDEARELADGIAGAQLRIIEGSGHMVPLEAPEVLATLIVDWLGSQRFG